MEQPVPEVVLFDEQEDAEYQNDSKFSERPQNRLGHVAQILELVPGFGNDLHRLRTSGLVRRISTLLGRGRLRWLWAVHQLLAQLLYACGGPSQCALARRSHRLNFVV